MSRPAALLPASPRFLLLFAAAELMLAMAIPFLAIKGYHTLLGSSVGVVVDQPQMGDPGWSALVEPTTVVGVAEVFDERLTGVTFVVVDDDGAASSIILGSGDLWLSDMLMADGDPTESVNQLARHLRLRLSSVEVVDSSGWNEALGTATVMIDNPDPVPAADGSALFDVGMVEVGGADAGHFLGIPSEGASLRSLEPRRRAFWSQITIEGLAGSGPLASLFPGRPGQAVDAVVFDLPTAEVAADGADEDAITTDLVAAETLLRTVVPFPAGLDGTDRLRIRLVDGQGDADLEGLARQIAARGLEVVEISVASTLSSDPSELIVPVELSAVVPDDLAGRSALDDLNELISTVDVEQGLTTRSDEQRTVTLVIGPDLDLEALSSSAEMALE